MRYLILAILLCTQALFKGLPPAHAQTSPILFHHQGNLNENGINFVSDILFDSRKGVWLAAQSGFYHYDGQHYIPYRKTKVNSTIPDNFVHALCEDKQGNIWGGTEAGIFRFNPLNRQFKQYFTPDTLADQGVTNICSDPAGGIWASNAFQLLEYNAATDAFEIRLNVNSAESGSTYNSIKKRGMLASPDGQYIWLATRQGLWAYHKGSGRPFNHETHPKNSLLARQQTSALAHGAGGKMMCFNDTHKVLVQFDPASMEITKTISLAGTVPDAIGAALFEAKDSTLWFSTWTGQVLMIDQQHNNRIYNLKSPLYEPLGLVTDFFWQARQDDDGSIWLATPEGIAICNEPRSLYKIHRLSKVIRELDSKVSIDVFAENPQDRSWWMTTSSNRDLQLDLKENRNVPTTSIEAGRLIIQFYPASGKYQTLDLASAPTNSKGLKPSSCQMICFFENDPVFITGNGAWVWHYKSKTWETLEAAMKVMLPFTITALLYDGSQGYYLNNATQLAYYHLHERTIKSVPIAGAPSGRNYSIQLYPRQQGKPMLYGSIGFTGLMQLQSDTAKLISLMQNSRLENVGYIDDIDVDNLGQVWISLKNVGLFRYNPQTGNINHWNESDGLSINGIHNLSVDHLNNVWTLHRRQLSVLLAGTNRFYQATMPIASNTINWSNNLVTLQNGHIVANNFNEVVEFFPDRLLQKPVARLPEISSLMVNEKPRLFSTDSILQLSPNENSLHFQFGMLTNRTFFPYELQYQLEGAENNWQTAGVVSEVFYNKLPPGHYTFKVRAVATNGSWLSAEQRLQLVIAKPLYLRWWFLLLSGLTLAGLLLSISRYRLQKQRQVYQLETKAADLEREKATIQYDSLKQQLNPHFLFNSLTSLASLIEADPNTAGNFLQRMSDMYRYILKSGDQESVALRHELQFAQLYIDIQQTRFSKGLQVSLNVPETYLNAHIAPVTLQNLIENAIKHNIVDEAFPLVIDIFVADHYLVIQNNLQKKSMVDTSNKKGLNQLKSLYSYLSEKPVLVEESAETFIVKIPLL